ncbi:MAG: type II secretion system F family protein [Nanoarchaeota archaeon]
MVDLVNYVYNKNPHLKKQLLEAHMPIHPKAFLARSLKSSAMYSFLLSVFAAFPLHKADMPLILAAFAFPVVFLFMFNMQMQIPKAAIKKRGKEMNNEVLFAGRYLLVKLSSGRPLFNALIDASQSYGIASKYFKEIVDDITFGTPIEDALENAVELSPSSGFKKILFQIHNALKTGTDVTRSLQTTIDEIESEQQIEIERYAKKLSSISMFYMLAAIVVPSLGLTMFVVITALLSIQLTSAVYIALALFIVMTQMFFMSVFKSIRPSVNL